jgi:cyclophilin family peptidyl-prolyl cis-trans isomerase
MSDRVPLRDYLNSRAVLVGTSTYRNLRPVPAAANSLQRMVGLLTSDLCGWPSGQITEIRDELGPGDLHLRLIRLFRDITDVALFYFVGHGQVDDKDQLCLGLVGSSEEPDLRASTSLEFQDVRDAMLRSRAETKILILDCCFSGLASEHRNTLGASDLADQAGGAGAYTMAACRSYGTASFETDGSCPQTHFTKYLVDVIETGIRGQSAGLRLRPIFRRLAETLEAVGHPRPMERNINSASEFVLAYNAAPVQVQIDVPTALQQMDARIARIEASLAAVAEQAEPPAPSPSPERAADQAPVTRSSPDAERAGEQFASVARLRAQAAEFLRVNKGEEFRVVEAQLQRLGSSARPTTVLQTSMGDITIQLLPDYAPEAVRNFTELAEGTRPWLDPRHREPLRRGVRLYDGTLFHRVIHGLMIQGGDPIGTGTGSPGYLQAHEFHRDLAFDGPYRVAMANSGPDSDGSQFFITVGPAPWLTHKHTIFGMVVDGTTVADRISEVPVDSDDRPIQDVALRTVRISAS